MTSAARRRDAAVEFFATADAFISNYRAGRTGCLLLDIGVSGEAGLALLERFPRQGALLPVIVVAQDPDVPLTVQAMRSGAAYVLEKPLTLSSLEAALDAALRLEEEQRRVRQRREDLLARLASLTEGERQVLERLVAGMANKNIAADLELGLRTVELRRAKILKKLGAKSLAELVRLVMIASPDLRDGA